MGLGLVLAGSGHNTYIHCMYTWGGAPGILGPGAAVRLPALRIGPDYFQGPFGSKKQNSPYCLLIPHFVFLFNK
jgi:hypothetical protein